MSRSVSIEIDDIEYEVEVTYVDFGQEPKGWDPGAGAEIELGQTVSVWGMVEKYIGPGSFNSVPGVIEKISLEEFIQTYAVSEDISRKEAERKLEDYCLENVRGQMEDEYDDSDV